MIQPKHFLWRVDGKVGVITLNRPDNRNSSVVASSSSIPIGDS